MKALHHWRYLPPGLALLALTLFLVVSIYRSSPPARATFQETRVPVILAARNLPKGTTLRLDDLQVALLSRTLADSIPGALQSKSLVVGLTTFMPIPKGDPVLASNLSSPPRYRDAGFSRSPRLLDSPLDWPLYPAADELASPQRR